MSEMVISRISGDLGIVNLNRPQMLNAFNSEFLHALNSVFVELLVDKLGD